MQIYNPHASEMVAALGPLTIFSKDKLLKLAKRFESQGKFRSAEWARSRAKFLAEEDENSER